MSEIDETTTTSRSTASPAPAPEAPRGAAASGGNGHRADRARLADAPAASAIGAMQDPTKPPKPKVDRALTGRRMISVAMMMPLFIIMIMPLLMTGMTTDIAPRDMQVAIIGTGDDIESTAQDLDEQSDGAFEVSVISSTDEARTQVLEKDVRAAFDPSDGTLYLAGVNGAQVTSAVTGFFSTVAEQFGVDLSTEDLQPLEDGDPSGSAGMYLALGAILGGFMTAIILSLMPVGSKIRLLLGLVMPAVFATGMIVCGWAVFGIFSGVAILPWAMLYLLSLTCLAVTVGFMLLLGPVAMPIAILLCTMLGMSSAGISAPVDMISPFYAAMHTWVFSAQGIQGVQESLYFEDASLTGPVLVMLAWLVGGVLLTVAGTVRQKRRHLFAMATDREETEVALAAGASAAAA